MDMDHSKGVHIISKLKYKNIYFPHFMEIDHLKGIFKYLSSNHWKKNSVANIRAWSLIKGNLGEELGIFEEDSVAAENLFSVEICIRAEHWHS